MVVVDFKCGDVLEVLAEIEDCAFDAIFCDPPYGISFMGESWDHGVPSSQVWREVMRVLKPGGHCLAFGGSRTYHRLAVAIEDAGFEIRDCMLWLYGSGFPKGADIGKMIDKAAGAEREVIGFDAQAKARAPGVNTNAYGGYKGQSGDITAPATALAQSFDGYRSALKPAYEPIVVAMKPLAGTYAANAAEHGVAGLNIDGSRIESGPIVRSRSVSFGDTGAALGGGNGEYTVSVNADGRYPANVIADEYVRDRLSPDAHDKDGDFFFYCAKASKAEREAGLRGDGGRPTFGDNGGTFSGISNSSSARLNRHPCVKPLDLCRYFSTMILPPRRQDGQVRKLLVPYSGSGSEAIGAALAGWDIVVGIEKEQKWIDIARARADHWLKVKSVCQLDLVLQ